MKETTVRSQLYTARKLLKIEMEGDRMRSEDLSRVIDAFGPSDAQKQRMFNQIIGHSSNQGRRRGRMAKVMILAVAIALFSGTAFALSTTELFKEIFGSSIDLVEEQILSPMESVADDQFRLTLEGYCQMLIAARRSFRWKHWLKRADRSWSTFHLVYRSNQFKIRSERITP